MKSASKIYRTQSTATDPLTAQTYWALQDVFTVGAGYLNITAALANRDLITGPAYSPKAMIDSSTGTARMTGDASVIWGDQTRADSSAIGGGSVIWGDSVIWGEGVRSTPQGESVIWGDQSPWADPAASSVIWGDAIVQGNSVIWGDSGSSDQ